MATILTSQYGVRQDTLFIVFDIEAIGDVNTPEKCRLWNLAGCVLGDPRDHIDLYVKPAIDEFPSSEFCDITEEKLEALGATTLQVCIQLFMNWIKKKKENPDTLIILLSHGCFRYDKILLEHEFMRNGMYFQPNIYFFDTLHYTRQTIRNRASYTLNDIHQDIFHKPIDNQHRAYGDTLALNNVICSLTSTGNLLSGVMYPPFFTPLVRMPGIGLCTERILVNKSIHCVEELYVMYRKLFSGSSDSFIAHLCRLGIPPDTSQLILRYILRNFGN